MRCGRKSCDNYDEETLSMCAECQAWINEWGEKELSGSAKICDCNNPGGPDCAHWKEVDLNQLDRIEKKLDRLLVSGPHCKMCGAVPLYCDCSTESAS